MAIVNAQWDGKNFVLSEEELVRLLESDMRLNALERAGVDNWEWYCEAHGEYLMEECPGFDSFDDVVRDAVAQLRGGASDE